MIQFEVRHIFEMGWFNHQPEIVSVIWLLPTPPTKTDDSWKKDARLVVHQNSYGIDDPIGSNYGKSHKSQPNTKGR